MKELIKDDLISVEIRKERTNMGLLERVFSGTNIADAINKVVANKGAGGVDKVTIEKFKEDFDNHKINFTELYELTKKRKYTPLPVKRVYIPKENGDKRGLGIPTIMDRVIQQAIVQVLSPIYEEQFSNSSYGFRPGRSCEQAIIKLLEHFNDGYEWVVDIDLEKFFDNVCHDKLISIIMKTVHDGELISLIRKYLTAGVMENGVVQESKKGTPQGGNLSPLLSNIMLNELDKELEARGLNFVRYADDCIIVVKSEKAANRVMESITKFLEHKLGLKVNATKSKIERPNKIKYLGFGFYKKTGQNKWRPKPHIKSMQKFIRKLKRLTIRKYNISLTERIKQLNYVVRGWINYFKISDMKNFMEQIGEHLRHRIRVIILKQWKTSNKKYKALRILGVSEENAYKIAHASKGLYYVGGCKIVSYAINNKLLKLRGLIMPEEYYLKAHVN